MATAAMVAVGSCWVSGCRAVRVRAEDGKEQRWAKRGRGHKKDPALQSKEASDVQLSSELSKIRINDPQYLDGVNRKRVLQSLEGLAKHYGNRYQVSMAVASVAEEYHKVHKGNADLITGSMERVVKAWEDSALLGKSPLWDRYKPLGVEAIADEIEYEEKSLVLNAPVKGIQEQRETAKEKVELVEEEEVRGKEKEKEKQETIGNGRKKGDGVAVKVELEEKVEPVKKGRGGSSRLRGRTKKQ